MDSDLSNLKKYRIFDLSHSLYHRMPGWPGHSQFLIKDLRIMNVDGYAVKDIYLNTHHGTHIDAAAHMIDGGKTLDKYPLSNFIGNGVVLDLSFKKAGEPIGAADLKKFDNCLIENDMIFLYTGWSRKRSNSVEYLYLWPYLDCSGAEYLAHKKMKVVGTDGLSIGGWSSDNAVHTAITDSAKNVHTTILGSDAIIAEEVANLDKVLEEEKCSRAFFIISPLNIIESDGSPVRIYAFKR
jgi:kynurenine formamidase